MKTYLDSSSFAKRFVEEEGSDRVETACSQASELGLSVICVPEVLSALNRRKRERTLTAVQYREANQRLLDDLLGAVSFKLTSSVIVSTIHILETNSVRTMDALHIACALEWGADLFASSDDRQLKAAKKAVLKTQQI